ALVLIPGAPRLDFMRGYNEIDIALDPFPFNAGMTMLETSYMGVPTVSKMGEEYVSRIGATILYAIGLQELVAKDEDEYVAIAERLANDREQLSILRASLRGRLDAAADPVRFTRNLEAAYRAMWIEYLEKGSREEP